MGVFLFLDEMASEKFKTIFQFLLVAIMKNLYPHDMMNGLMEKMPLEEIFYSGR